MSSASSTNSSVSNSALSYFSASTSPYLYPATLNVSNFVNLRLKQSNYLLWLSQILGLVESQDMKGFLDGGCTSLHQVLTDAEGSQPTVNLQYLAWQQLDRLLRGWLTGTLSEDVLNLVVGLETSTEVSRALEEAFALDSQEREFYLRQQLQLLKKGNMSMNDYLSKFKSICDVLAAIGKPLSDKDKTFWVLNGLGCDYDSFVTSMLKPPIPSYRELIPLLQGYETCVHLYESNDLPQMALYGRVTQKH